MVLITPEECRSLPPIRLALDETGLLPTRFPDAGSYLRLSGPPGGPLGLVVQPCEDLDRWLVPSAEAVVRCEVELAGARRTARAYLLGSGHARAHHTAVAIGLVVCDFFCAAGPSARPDPKAPLAALATVVASLVFG